MYKNKDNLKNTILIKIVQHTKIITFQSMLF